MVLLGRVSLYNMRVPLLWWDWSNMTCETLNLHVQSDHVKSRFTENISSARC